MLKYAFVMGDTLQEAIIIFQSQENDPPTRWHIFDRVGEKNALLIVESLNENEKKQLSQIQGE